jgi:hypothetical protein
VGVYTMPTLGGPFLDAQHTVNNFYGPVPVAYLKLQAAKNTQFLIGQLPTLMGAESTFTYQNFNIERGIVWNQENAINRGIQVNQTLGKYLSAAISWNDGYYSDRYSWISGSATLTKGHHALVYDGMGNLGQTVFQTAATPLANNSYMHAVIYTYTKGPWIVSPYFQYSKLPTNAKVGVAKGTSATGGALNVSYAFKSGFSLPARVEYLTSSGSALPSLRRPPTKREACIFAAISLLCMQRIPPRALSSARQERTRANSGPHLNSASSSAKTSSRNSRLAASTPQSRAKLNHSCHDHMIPISGLNQIGCPRSRGATLEFTSREWVPQVSILRPGK